MKTQTLGPIEESTASRESTQIIKRDSNKNLDENLPLPTSGRTISITGSKQDPQSMTTSHHTVGGLGVGTITFRPLEIKFNHTLTQEAVDKMEPYCKFKIGWRSGKTGVGKLHDEHHQWKIEDSANVKVKKQEYAKLKVKDKKKLPLRNRLLGSAQIPLGKAIEKGYESEWISLTKNNVIVGKLLLEMVFDPSEEGKK